MADDSQGRTRTAISRRRASKACLACRARKVRCDVTERGPPCMHCRLDHGDCIVKPRPAKYRKIRGNPQSVHSGFSVGAAPEPQEIAQPSSQSATVEEILPNSNCTSGQDEAGSFQNSLDLFPEELEREALQQKEPREAQCASQYIIGESDYRAFEPTIINGTPFNVDSGLPGALNTHVIYSYYPFLGLDTLPYMTPEDANFLESQGCFRVPVRPLLDYFVQEYFLHVHPGLPIIDEGIFWEMYTNRSIHSAEHPRISLFVFQAMVFAASCFVSLEVIRNLGFTDARNARATYYRRAKLLFDFEGDRDSISTSQGALLLSYQPPMQNHNKINTFWLGIAIQFAKDAGAHRYHTRESLDAIALCELAVVLTDVIMLLYPLHESIDSILSADERVTRSLNLLATCRCALTGWFKKIFMSFPQPSLAGDVHKSVILYTDLMYIYYHSAILAISQFEILVSAKGPNTGDTQRHRICRSKVHLVEAASSFTDILKELNRHELTKYLPVSVVAYAALPLVLHILDVKLATTEIHSARKHKRLKIYTETMKVFKSQYEATDGVSDIIARMINYVSLESPMQQHQLTITNDDASSPPHNENSRSATVSIPMKALSVVSDWGGVLLRQPNLYLRFALTIDLALEIGHFPDENDFPIALQWRNTTTARFPMYRITMSDIGYRSDSGISAEKSGCENQYATISNDMPTIEHTTNAEEMHNSPISTSPSTDAFISQMLLSASNENYQNDDLDLAMDFGSFEMTGQDEGDTEFSYATTWPDESFL